MAQVPSQDGVHTFPRWRPYLPNMASIPSQDGDCTIPRWRRYLLSIATPQRDEPPPKMAAPRPARCTPGARGGLRARGRSGLVRARAVGASGAGRGRAGQGGRHAGAGRGQGGRAPAGAAQRCGSLQQVRRGGSGGAALSHGRAGSGAGPERGPGGARGREGTRRGGRAPGRVGTRSLRQPGNSGLPALPPVPGGSGVGKEARNAGSGVHRSAGWHCGRSLLAAGVASPVGAPGPGSGFGSERPFVAVNTAVIHDHNRPSPSPLCHPRLGPGPFSPFLAGTDSWFCFQNRKSGKSEASGWSAAGLLAEEDPGCVQQFCR